LHDRYRRRKSLAARGLAGLVFLIARFTAETAIGFPLLILASDWIRDRRPRPLRAACHNLAMLLHRLGRREEAPVMPPVPRPGLDRP
jgi:hypothetical protein